MLNFYELSATKASLQSLDFGSLKNKVVMVVNVASLCGFSHQYDDLEQLYQKYKNQGFEIIAFPCNQFGGQEPEEGDRLEAFIREKFKCTFPIMQKTMVNGEDTHPVFQYLKEKQTGSLGFKGIRWNFEKFVIDRKGEVRARYVSAVSPMSIEPVIVTLLNEA